MRLQFPTGALLAGFRIEFLIGEGATGTVYRARDPDGTLVALKVLAPELARDDRFRLRFLREAQAASKLDHPNIVRTLGYGEEEGVVYLAMAFVEGPDLRRLLQREGRLDPRRALGLLEQVARGLDAAHAAGLVHRDVKPGNILVGSDRAYVCDFGLARHLTSPPSVTSERGLVGTVDYVPPEQIEGGMIDGRADVYSLACVLFECLTGDRPFARETDLSVLFAHLNEPPPAVSDLLSELPQSFDDVFDTALAKSPEARYGTCAELVDAARAALAGRAVGRKTMSRRRRGALIAGAAAVIAGATTVGVALSHGSGSRSHASLRLQPNALTLVDARTRRVVSSIGLGPQSTFGAAPEEIVFSGDTGWVLSGTAQRLERIDANSHRLAQIVRLPWIPGSRVALGARSLWLTQSGGSGVLRIDSRKGTVLQRLSVSGRGDGIAFGHGAIWLARDFSIARINPSSGQVGQRVFLPDKPSWIAFADDALWVASAATGAIYKIDPVAGRVIAKVKLHGWLSDLTVGGGFVWASNVPDGTIFQLSEDNLSVLRPALGGADPERMSFGDGRLWIANSHGRAVSGVDSSSLARTELRLTLAPSVVRYHRGLLWVGAGGEIPALPPIAGHELVISTPKPFTDADPSTAQPLRQNQQLFYASCANLLNHPDVSGAGGIGLQPELARGMPTLSPDRRTYVFRVRAGIRFSPPSNELVSAETFRHTIERALSPKLESPPAEGLVADIEGEAAFRAGTTRHISGITARGNVLSITLVRPSGSFLERISAFTFCPVPLSEPVVPDGLTGPIPSLGPYYAADMTDAYTVLLRNPHYTGRRPRRASRIVYRFGMPTPQAIAETNNGTIDLLPSDFDQYSPLSPYGIVDREYGPGSPAARRGDQRYFREPTPFVHMLVLNARRPLFRDPRMRRAVGYALDRPKLTFSDLGAEPADQLVPRAVPGFSAGRVYPLRRPNLTVARRLAGSRKRHAVLDVLCGAGDLPLPQIVRSDLAQIGIAISIVKSDACPVRYTSQTDRADLLLVAMGGPLQRDPEFFLDSFLYGRVFGTVLGPGPWDDAPFRARVARARALSGRARIDAYRRLDDELMQMAPVAVYGSALYTEFVSPKVGCRIFQGYFGFLDLGALCVRR